MYVNGSWGGKIKPKTRPLKKLMKCDELNLQTQSAFDL